MDIASYIYQRSGYPLGELIRHATLRARDSRRSVRIVLENGTHLDVNVPEGMQ